MCCRYYMEMSPELRPIIEEANRSALKERIVDKLGRPLITEGEVRPTNIVPVIALHIAVFVGQQGHNCRTVRAIIAGQQRACNSGESVVSS